MTTLAVILSISCLLTALVELRLRADLAGRRMAAVLATAAWATMGFVALDEARKCDALQRVHSIRGAVIHADNMAIGGNQPIWTYKTPDGATIEYNRGGVESRLAGNGGRF